MKHLDLTGILEFMNNTEAFFEELKEGLSDDEKKELESNLSDSEFKDSISKAKKEIEKAQLDIKNYGKSL